MQDKTSLIVVHRRESLKFLLLELVYSLIRKPLLFLYSCSLRYLLVHSSPDSETYICVIAGGIEGTEWSHRIQGGTPNPVQVRPAEAETARLSQGGRVESRLWRQYHRPQRLLRPWNHERHPCRRHNPRKLDAQPHALTVLRTRSSQTFLVQDRHNNSISEGLVHYPSGVIVQKPKYNNLYAKNITDFCDCKDIIIIFSYNKTN